MRPVLRLVLRPLLALAGLWLAGPCLSAPAPPPLPPPLRTLTPLEKKLPQSLQAILAYHLPGRVKAAASLPKGAKAHANAAQADTAATPPPPANGATPQGLMLARDGNYYGLAMTGGANNNGVLYRLAFTSIHGLEKMHYSVLYTFSAVGADFFSNADGVWPIGTLTEDRNSPGTFYGATFLGGTRGGGTVFRFTTSDATLTTLHSFAAGSPVPTDGALPVGSLCQAQDGAFYGATYAGGYSANDGTLYKVTAAGDYKQLHVFTYGEGTTPSPVVEDTSNPGTFYGTTLSDQNTHHGGVSTGSVFRATSAGRVTFLHYFSTPDIHRVNAEGYQPAAGLLLASDGNFYGTASAGGQYGCGTVFKMDRAGNTTLVFSFLGGEDGAFPECKPVEDRTVPGDLYGVTTSGGGLGNHGTVFWYPTHPVALPPGTMSAPEPLSHSFHGDTGDMPSSTLLQTPGGGFFGTTSYGGVSFQDHRTGNGVIFVAGDGGARVIANLNPGTYYSVAASTTGGGTSTPSVPNADYTNPARVGQIEQARPGAAPETDPAYQYGNYDWTGMLTTLKLMGQAPQYGNAYLGQSAEYFQEIDAGASADTPQGGSLDVSGTSTFKWKWAPYADPLSGIENSATLAPNDPKQPYPTPPLFVLSRVGPYTEGDLGDDSQTAVAHGSVQDGYTPGYNPSFTGLPGSAPLNGLDGSGDYQNDLPRRFVAAAALEADGLTSHSTISPSLHVDIAPGYDTDFDAVFADLTGAPRWIEMIYPSEFARPDLGDGHNQFTYDSTGELDIPAEITAFGANQDDTQWLVGQNPMGPKSPDPPVVNWQFDDQSTAFPLTSPPHGYKVMPSTDSNNDNYSLYPDTAGADGTQALKLLGMPADDRFFGNHTVHLTVNTYDPVAKTSTTNTSEVAHVQTFFKALDYTHPSSNATEAAEPNWFYYYNQVYPVTGAGGYYAAAYTSAPGPSRSHPPYPGDERSNTIEIHDDAFRDGVMRVYDIDPNDVDPDLYAGNPYPIRYVGTLELHGIFSFIGMTAHEQGHVDSFRMPYSIVSPVTNTPYTSPPSVSVTRPPDGSGGDIYAPGSNDGDNLWDAWEATHNLDPYTADTTGAFRSTSTLHYTLGPDVPDNEVVADLRATGEIFRNIGDWQYDWADYAPATGTGTAPAGGVNIGVPYFVQEHPFTTPPQRPVFYLKFTPAKDANGNPVSHSGTPRVLSDGTWAIRNPGDLQALFPSVLTGLSSLGN